MKEKRQFSFWRLLPAVFVVLLLGIWYFPLYNQPGVHITDEFLQNTADGIFKGTKTTVFVQEGVLSFTSVEHESLLPLSVIQDEEVYTIFQEDELLFAGKVPDAEHDRTILADGTLTVSGSGEENSYPVTISQAIAIASGDLSTRGSSQYLLLALAILAIWCIDILFPDFFFRIDFRQMGRKSAPSLTYRKIQKVLWVVLPLWGLMCLVMAII